MDLPFEIKEENGFRYIDEGKGKNLVLLHGLFGALSNWQSVVNRFSSQYRVLIPLLPIYEMPIKKAGMEGLVRFFTEFVALKQLDHLMLMGNSLGGHIALIYTLENPEKVDRMILTGSSGLFENTMGGSFPRRGSYAYVKEILKHRYIFQCVKMSVVSEMEHISCLAWNCYKKYLFPKIGFMNYACTK